MSKKKLIVDEDEFYSPENETMQWWVHCAIELFNGGVDDMKVDYEKKDGTSGKLKITIEDVS